MTPDQPITKQDLDTAITAAETRIVERLTEVMREMQTEILRGLEQFARGNFARLHTLTTRVQALDAISAATDDRITALEERVLALETRPPRP